ncbi:hypothetical protein AAY473_031746 [Plecturocebus cupreus]
MLPAWSQTSGLKPWRVLALNRTNRQNLPSPPPPNFHS